VNQAWLPAIVSAHAFSTIAMCGLCWFVQVIHYPLFGLVGAQAFTRYEDEHVRRTTLIVAPLMLTELTTAALLVALAEQGNSGVPKALAWIGAALLALVWISTFTVQVPLHGRLRRSFDARTLRSLVLTNWPRTLLWTARSAVAIWMLWAAAESRGA
jgi:hypothetical protein